MSYESAAGTIGHINLDKNAIGKRSAGKPHAAFDEAGTGNGIKRWNKTPERTKVSGNGYFPPLRLPRQFSTLPVRGIEIRFS